MASNGESFTLDIVGDAIIHTRQISGSARYVRSVTEGSKTASLS